jgi:hypothetical protein
VVDGFAGVDGFAVVDACGGQVKAVGLWTPSAPARWVGAVAPTHRSRWVDVEGCGCS